MVYQKLAKINTESNKYSLGLFKLGL